MDNTKDDEMEVTRSYNKYRRLFCGGPASPRFSYYVLNGFMDNINFLIIKKTDFHENQNVFGNNNRNKLADCFFVVFIHGLCNAAAITSVAP